jgi:hypothetical protein
MTEIHLLHFEKLPLSDTQMQKVWQHHTDSLSGQQDFYGKHKLLVQNMVLTTRTQQYLKAPFCASYVAQMRRTKYFFCCSIRDCPELTELFWLELDELVHKRTEGTEVTFLH